MPVGAGGDALVRIEAALAGLALLFGLLAIGAGPTGILALLLLGGTLFACVVTARGVSPDSASPPAA